MEEREASTKGATEVFGFNRKRAEGRDESDRPKKNLQLKVRKLNPANTIAYVQILGTGMDTQDTSPSVLLFFDKQRFIFNAGEGLQRFCSEHKIKLSKIDHIFLSRVCSETAGGLPGLLLTLAGMGDEGMSGKFDPKKAAALGLRPGPKFRELQLGNSVKSDREDITVHPSDVLGPSVPGPIVLLVDCPTSSHLQDLSSLQCLTPYYVDTAYDVPEESLAKNQRIKFQQRIFLRDTSAEKASVDAETIITEEPWLHERTLPSCLENITREEMEIVLLGTGSSQPSKYRNVSSIFINLFSKGSILLDCGEGTLGQLKRRFGVQGADEAVRGLKCIWISHIHADHHTGLARILALRRDLLKGVPHEPIIIVGPRQLKRFLDAYQRLEDLDMQFLDCWHTTEASLEALELKEDNTMQESPGHFQGTKNGNTVGLVGENVDSTLFARGSRMQSFWKRPGSPTQIAAAIPILKSLKKVLAEGGLEALISFPVVHCPQAFGVVLQAANRINKVGKTIPGWKIVYSGDTRPCPELVKASRGATVLIHEASDVKNLLACFIFII
ncbi:UNVERIFIED_CONTAM: tRNAse Z TRZ4, mitochondrial [Sesamum calycinum]|uniref:ribonuclease Z n=1 Tax=Sesamum calycinum TaxID=2727403 RepID=A0AAW2NGU8_9LAMI